MSSCSPERFSRMRWWLTVLTGNWVRIKTMWYFFRPSTQEAISETKDFSAREEPLILHGISWFLSICSAMGFRLLQVTPRLRQMASVFRRSHFMTTSYVSTVYWPKNSVLNTYGLLRVGQWRAVKPITGLRSFRKWWRRFCRFEHQPGHHPTILYFWKAWKPHSPPIKIGATDIMIRLRKPAWKHLREFTQVGLFHKLFTVISCTKFWVLKLRKIC